ncbi:hypothetical protein Golax_000026 [Gossypium laxum]|uniref:Uncharacterized protein n=1 Tax=Gossypium laxum TaxID=34288 RepID=A0A7J9B0G8_9ROSI|nr:hypothetical protein [Gossypium laxum]
MAFQLHGISLRKALVHIRSLDRKLIMEKGFLDKVEDNAAIRTWSEAIQREKGDSLAKGNVSELWDFTHISVTQNSLQELKEIWDQWNDEVRQLFYSNYGDLPYLLDMKVDKHLFRALAQFEILPMIQVDRAYSRAVSVPTFSKKLMNITGMSEQWVAARIKQKGDSKCIPWKNLKDIILAQPDTKKKVDVFALNIYGLVIFPKALGHVDEAVTYLFDRLDKRVTPYRSRQFIPTTRGLAECEFSYKGDGCKKKIQEISNAWNQTRRIKRLAVGSMMTPEYNEWWVRRINDNILEPSQENSRSIEEHLRVVPSKLEIIRQDFETRNAELEKKIEQMEEEKINLRLDMDVQKLEAEKLKKGKNKAEQDLNSLKIDYKKLRLSMRTVGLGKTLEQWREKIRGEKNKADRWERKFQEVQNQVRNRDHIMGEAVAQVREVADHLQTLAVQADTLSVKYELESNQGQELALLLRKIRVLSIREKPYL